MENQCKIQTQKDFKKMLLEDPLFKQQIKRIFDFFSINRKLSRRIDQLSPPKKYSNFSDFMEDQQYIKFFYDSIKMINMPEILNAHVNRKYVLYHNDFNKLTSRFEVNGFLLDIENKIKDMVVESEKLIDLEKNKRVGITRIKIKNHKKALILKYKFSNPSKSLDFNQMFDIIKQHKTNKQIQKKITEEFYDAHEEDFNEILISNIINLMNFVCPLFPYFYYASLSSITYNGKELPVIVSIQEDSGYRITEIIKKFSDKNNPVSLQVREDFYSSMIEQLTFGLYMAQKAFSFIHFDLHEGNVLFEKIDKKQKMYYKYSNGQRENIYEVKTNGFIFHLIDFGRSRVRIGKQYYYNRAIMSMVDKKILYQSDLIYLARNILISWDSKLASILQNPNNSKYKFVRYFNAILNCDGNYSVAFPSFSCPNNRMINCSSKNRQNLYHQNYSLTDSCVSAQPSKLISKYMTRLRVKEAKKNHFVIPLNSFCLKK